MRIIEDVTDKYFNMINSFNADLSLKVREIKDNEIAFHKSFFDMEKDLIKENNVHYMEDIDLLDELVFDLRHENIKIVKIDKEEL